MNVLLLGIGNLLLSDEGVGVRAIEALEQRFTFPEGVELMDGGTAGMELMEAMAKRELLLVVDAVKSSHQPGSVFMLQDDEVPALFTQKISPHQLGLSDVLMALKLTDEFPEKLVLFGIEPESLEPGMTLSDTVKQSMEVAIREVICFLDEQGISVTQRKDALCTATN